MHLSGAGQSPLQLVSPVMQSTLSPQDLLDELEELLEPELELGGVTVGVTGGGTSSSSQEAAIANNGATKKARTAMLAPVILKLLILHPGF